VIRFHCLVAKHFWADVRTCGPAVRYQKGCCALWGFVPDWHDPANCVEEIAATGAKTKQEYCSYCLSCDEIG
jgi:hypothetical protein